MNLSEQLRAYRIKNGLSQTDVSNIMHISRQSISKWEHGTITPSIENLKELSKIYHVSLDVLLENEANVEKSYKNNSTLLLVMTAVCAIIPVIDLIGPIYILKVNNKGNGHYKLIKYMNYISFIISILSYIYGYFLSKSLFK
ncbi:hypothetical protein RD055328_12620 [Companilactobacillus sp. RD055328]|uniref:helix-turn-helix domain-containing protein n=1 Tax=Companilactobacillus sp. RD055328 TaxID=2916634 RepID=UPI001FC88592|nr:helix-turn-helix transcriptional regulator [Companilactobacillus sp. RD055328]GKQ43339.1 hypothetical protein RD055328_12620 [Companilactobacillus sp. RD055328]